MSEQEGGVEDGERGGGREKEGGEGREEEEEGKEETFLEDVEEETWEDETTWSGEAKWDQLRAHVLECTGDSNLDMTIEDLKALFVSQHCIAKPPHEIRRDVLASGYEGFDENLLLRDEARLREVGSVVALVSLRIDEQRGDLLSVERIRRQDTSSADPVNLARVLEGAEKGFRMPFPAEFVAAPNVFPKVSKLVASLHEPLLQKIQDKVERGRAVVFRASELARYPCPFLHMSPLHAVPKGTGDKSTVRPVIDYMDHKSRDMKGWCNSDEYFGPQELAGVLAKIAMINHGLHRAQISGETVVFDHFDLANAYDIPSLVAEQACAFAYTMIDAKLGRLIFVPLSPQMGSPGAPGAFNRVSKLALSVVSKATEHLALTENYVDDFAQVAFEGPGPEDKQFLQAADITVAVLTDLLGPKAVSHSKTVIGTKVMKDCGYLFSVEVKGKECVEFTREGLTKALFVFCSVEDDFTRGVTLWDRVKAQSHGTRLSSLYPQVKPLVPLLYAVTKGIQLSRSTRGIRLVVDEAYQACIRVLKAFYVMLIMDSGKHSCRKRLLSSFLPRPISFLIEYDASLTGGGIFFSKPSVTNNGWERFAVAAFLFPFELVHPEVEVAGGALVKASVLKKRRKRLNSALQNSAEFIVGTVGVALLIERGLQKADVILQGDSKSALSWAQKQRVRSEYALRASTAWMQLTSTAYVAAADTIHVPGVDNGDCDILSRGGDPTILFPSLQLWPVEGAVAELLDACNPMLPKLTSTREVFASWKQFETLTDKIIGDGGQGERMELG